MKFSTDTRRQVKQGIYTSQIYGVLPTLATTEDKSKTNSETRDEPITDHRGHVQDKFREAREAR
jgi:hypothetical protein